VDENSLWSQRRVGHYGFELNRLVKVWNGDGIWYTGKMIDMQNGRIRIHYDGWSMRFDEWIPAGSQRMHEMTAEEILEAEEQKQFIEDEDFEDDQKELVEGIEGRRYGTLSRRRRQSVKQSRKAGADKASNARSKAEDHQKGDEDDDVDDRSSSVMTWEDLNLRRSTRRLCRLSAQEQAHKEREAEKLNTTIRKLLEKFKPGVKVEARDKLTEWYPATISAVKGHRILVHFDEFPKYYDEWIDVGSDRLRAIDASEESGSEENEPLTEGHIKRNRKSKLEDVNEYDFEYILDDVDCPDDGEESDNWHIYCNQCNVVIKQHRYYCTYCESPSDGYDYKSFELCLWCFSHNFPKHHEHPRSSFAMQSIMGDEIPQLSVKGELVSTFEKDILDTAYRGDDEDLLKGNVPLDSDMGYLYLKKWKDRKICGFCNDDDEKHFGGFIGPHPFVACAPNKLGHEKRRTFWAHYACARYSPEVFLTKDNDWYNVAMAWRRGRNMKCGKCKERGATIGCFEPKCLKSYHVACTDKPLAHFEIGVIFWCPQHEAKQEDYNEIFRCDGCSSELQGDKWWTCKSCTEKKFFFTFDLCPECYDNHFPDGHEHGKDEFEETSSQKLKEAETAKRAAMTRAREKNRNPGLRRKSTFTKFHKQSTNLQCSYCWSEESSRWRKGMIFA